MGPKDHSRQQRTYESHHQPVKMGFPSWELGGQKDGIQGLISPLPILGPSGSWSGSWSRKSSQFPEVGAPDRSKAQGVREVNFLLLASSWGGSRRPSPWVLPGPTPQAELPQHTLNTEGAWPWYFSCTILRMGMRFWKVGRKEASASQQFFMR